MSSNLKLFNDHKNDKILNLHLVEDQSWLEIAQQNDLETQNLIRQVIFGELDENRYRSIIYCFIKPSLTNQNSMCRKDLHFHS